MSFLGKLFGGGRRDSDDGLYLHVRCNSCGEPIRIRVNPANDLSERYDEDGGDDSSGYELRKEILGNKCFKLIEATWEFDNSRRKVGSHIRGGTEITAEEYERETATPGSATT